MIDYLENGNITNSVNLPNVIINRNCKTRVTVIHKNIPQMITAIAGVFGDCGVNIENLTNKSKKEYAYTVVDTNGDASEDAISKLKAIDGVIRVNIYR